MPEHDGSVQSAQRRAKLAQLRAEGDPYPNDFKRDALAADLQRRFGSRDQAALEAAPTTVRIAGRMMTRRVMGKAAFAHLQDMSGRIQLYLRRELLGEGRYEAFKDWDIGDVIGATGSLFKTKTGELSVAVQSVRLLAKSLHPLPEKFHGLSDVETRYRQRYLDLIMNETSRRVFERRSAIIEFIRDYLKGRGYLFIPYAYGYEFKVILTNKRLSARKALAFHQGRGSQEGIFAELKTDNGLDYVPTRTWVGNQIYLLSVLLAHNLGRELQMIAHPPSRTTLAKRPAL